VTTETTKKNDEVEKNINNFQFS